MKFTYIPQYYDPEKEELEERIRAAKGSANQSLEAMKMRIGRSYTSRLKERKQSIRQANRARNKRLFIIIGVLFALAYILLEEFLPNIEAYLD